MGRLSFRSFVFAPSEFEDCHGLLALFTVLPDELDILPPALAGGSMSRYLSYICII